MKILLRITSMLVTRWQASIMPSIDQVRTIFLTEGLQPEEEIYKPEISVQNHRHPFDEIRMIVSGELYYNVSGNKLLLRPGDRIEIPSNTKHSLWVEGSVECVSMTSKRPFRAF